MDDHDLAGFEQVPELHRLARTANRGAVIVRSRRRRQGVDDRGHRPHRWPAPFAPISRW